MRLTAAKNMVVSVLPIAGSNVHRVNLCDKDMGKVMLDVRVPNMKAFVYISITMDIQVDGFIRTGESILIDGHKFFVDSMEGGWYKVCFTDRRYGSFELCSSEIRLDYLNMQT